MKYLIDTDWLIDHLSGVKTVEMKLEDLAPEGLAISIISLAEVYEEIFYSRDPRRAKALWKHFYPGFPFWASMKRFAESLARKEAD